MKPFDLEKALAGAPCITRSGNEARVVFHDPTEKGQTTVLAVIKKSNTTNLWDNIWVRRNGRNYRCAESIDDLFMADDDTESEEKIDLSQAKAGDKFELKNGKILTITNNQLENNLYEAVDSDKNYYNYLADGRPWYDEEWEGYKMAKKFTPPTEQELPQTPRSMINPCSGCGIYPQRFTVTLGAMFFQCNSCMKSGYPHLQYEDSIQSWNAINPILTKEN